MDYRQIPPPADLVPYVHYFGILKSETHSAGEATFRIIADGNPGLVFQQIPGSFLDGDNNQLPQVLLHGLTTTHAQKTATGPYCNIVVCFQPHAIKSVFGIDAHELTDRCADVRLLVKNNPGELLQQEGSTKQLVAVLSDFIRRQIILNGQNENRRIALAIALLRDDNRWSLARVRSQLNLSERSLERLFSVNVGISPKLFLRIHRFQAALNTIRNQCDRPALTRIAYEYAYADQSHFIRDFKEFAGANPRQYVTKAYEQVANFPEWRS